MTTYEQRIGNAVDAFRALTEMKDPLEEEFDRDRARREAKHDRELEHAAEENHDRPEPEHRARFTDPNSLLKFMLAGRAHLTVRSRTTGARFTYRISRPKKEDYQRGRRALDPVWVSVLSGPDNNSAYAFIGTIWVGDGRAWELSASAKSRVALTAPSAVAFRWILKMINEGKVAKLMHEAEFWHEGCCGRCGRRLTVPESIASGIGPECATQI